MPPPVKMADAPPVDKLRAELRAWRLAEQPTRRTYLGRLSGVREGVIRKFVIENDGLALLTYEALHKAMPVFRQALASKGRLQASARPVNMQFLAKASGLERATLMRFKETKSGWLEVGELNQLVDAFRLLDAWEFYRGHPFEERLELAQAAGIEFTALENLWESEYLTLTKDEVVSFAQTMEERQKHQDDQNEARFAASSANKPQPGVASEPSPSEPLPFEPQENADAVSPDSAPSGETSDVEGDPKPNVEQDAPLADDQTRHADQQKRKEILDAASQEVARMLEPDEPTQGKEQEMADNHPGDSDQAEDTALLEDNTPTSQEWEVIKPPRSTVFRGSGSIPGGGQASNYAPREPRVEPPPLIVTLENGAFVLSISKDVTSLQLAICVGNTELSVSKKEQHTP